MVKSNRFGLIAVATVLSLALAGGVAAAQMVTQFQTVNAQVTQADAVAASHVSNIRIHVQLRQEALKGGNPAAWSLAPGTLDRLLGNSPPQSSPAIVTAPDTPTISFFPGRVTKGPGTVVVSAQSHSVFLNCAGDLCWGNPNPNTFLTNLGLSTFVHVLDQYAGSTANGRYTVGTAVNATFPIYAPANTLSQNDILQIVHASAVATGKLVGYGHIYHVFLPKGVDTCFDPSLGGGCYSPDNFSTFVFCAYH